MYTHSRSALIACAVLILLIAPIAVGAGEGEPLDGGTRNPSPSESVEYTRETEIIADSATYGTRQSNDVRFTGDLSECAIVATVTGTEAGHATVTPNVAADKRTTSVDVRTFDGGGAAADRGFHLHAVC